VIHLQGQVAPDNAVALAALRGMLDNPAGYYVNLHTTANAGGLMRGQLMRADAAVLMGLMSPLNEVPPIPGLAASGVSHVLVLTTRDAAGALTSGQLVFDLNYSFPERQTFTGFHIHPAPAGVNGGVVFNTGIGGGAASVQSEPSGVGNLRRSVEVNLGNAAQAQALEGLLANPANYYVNLHTSEFGGGAIRSQLRRTDRMVFQANMLPSNEAPPVTGLEASAPAAVRVHTLRAEDGSVLAGVVEFDVNYRFPGETSFTGLHVHRGEAGVAGPVNISSGLSGADGVSTVTGQGNVSRAVTVSTPAGIAALNALVSRPEDYYVNLHTTVHGGGAVRAQLAAANSTAPSVDAVISATQDRNATTFAPGQLIAIYGSNLAKVSTDLAGWDGRVWPDLLNGVAVAVGGHRAHLYYVSPMQVIAQVPVDVEPGRRLLSVNNGNAPSAPVAVNIAPAAPAIFGFPAPAVIRSTDSSLISRDNPARAGDVLIIYVTGLGRTSPALASGAIAPASPAATTVPVTVTIGGQNAEVVSSIATPGVAGVYEVAVRMPAGPAAGSAPLVVSAGGAASNPVPIAVQ
jgi:uncharacterized protein (TIGR03437 family)